MDAKVPEVPLAPIVVRRPTAVKTNRRVFLCLGAKELPTSLAGLCRVVPPYQAFSNRTEQIRTLFLL